MPAHPLQPDASAELVRAAQGGDQARFDELVRQSLPRVRQLVRARLGPELRRHEESGDLVQTSLLGLVRGLPRFEYRGPGSFLRWLSTLVEHKIRRHLRDLHRKKRDPGFRATVTTSALPAGGGGPEQAAEAADLEQRYQQAVLCLTPEEQALLQHFEAGRTFQQIADACCIASADAARKRVARLLARLQQQIGTQS